MLGQINRVDPTDQTLSSSALHEEIMATDEVDPDFTGVVLDPTDVTWATISTEPPEKNENIVNIMLIGQDARPGEGRQRSDSMILCTINKEAGKLTMTSFQRDSYVQIPGYSKNRLNAAYAWGGMELLEATLLHNYGVTLDGIVEVNFTGFTTIVDMLGGVTVTLTEKEANWIGLQPGTQKLNGEKALAYARIRKIDSDFNRTKRQRTIITSLLQQSRNISLTRMNSLLESCLKLVTTNLTDKEIIQYALDFYPLLKDLTIESGSIPSKDNYVSAMIDGRYVLIVDFEDARARLEAIMNGE